MILGGQFELEIRGQFKLERGGQFRLEEGGQLAADFPFYLPCSDNVSPAPATKRPLSPNSSGLSHT